MWADSWRPKLCVTVLCLCQMRALCCSAACRAAEVLTDRSDDHTHVVEVVGLLSLLVGGESLGGNFHSSHIGPKAVKMFERQQNEILKSLPLCNFFFFFLVSRFVFSSSWMERQRTQWIQRFGQTLGEVRLCNFFAQSRLCIWNVHICLNKAQLNDSYRARTSWNIELNISNISWKSKLM